MMSAQTKLSVDTAAEVKNDPSLKTKVRVCLFVCFKGRLLPLPDELVLICSIHLSCESHWRIHLQGHA